LKEIRPATKFSEAHKGTQLRSDRPSRWPKWLVQPTVTRVLVVGYKGGGWRWGGRVNPIRTPPHSVAPPIADPLAPLLISIDGSVVAASCSPLFARPLGMLLRHRIESASPLSSAPLPFFHHRCSTARPGRRVPRLGRMTFAGWGGEAGELPEHPVAARTQQIRWRIRARRASFRRWKRRWRQRWCS
jgi:hypothetical protein